MTASAHFDRRGPSYDASGTHRRILEVLFAHAPLRAGMRVLDVATGTGAAALQAAEIVGEQGSVLGIDVSEGMLAEARRKAAETRLLNVRFEQADAESFERPPASMDVLFCASGLVMMRDVPGALRRWAGWLKPGGFVAFDVPAKPFGLSEKIAAAARGQGLALPYDTVADTPEKCRALLEFAGLQVTQVVTEVVADDLVTVDEAIRFFEERRDHPAWRVLREASRGSREAVRDAFLRGVKEEAVAGRVRSTVAQHFVYGRKSGVGLLGVF
jgi:ubiquinone/menaquinone biosynthesis C-methylase UbiE